MNSVPQRKRPKTNTTTAFNNSPVTLHEFLITTDTILFTFHFFYIKHKIYNFSHIHNTINKFFR